MHHKLYNYIRYEKYLLDPSKIERNISSFFSIRYDSILQMHSFLYSLLFLFFYIIGLRIRAISRERVTEQINNEKTIYRDLKYIYIRLF